MLLTFIILVIIGAAVGWAMLHHGSTWLRQQFATTSGEITYGLVGVAGSFMGYHIGGILGIARADCCSTSWPSPAPSLTVYLWRGR